MPTSGFSTALIAACLLCGGHSQEKADYAPTYAPPTAAAPANGAIFQGSFTPLTSGARAGRVGDILTIDLVERTIAQKSTSAKTGRDGSIGLTLPATGPLSLFAPSAINSGGTQSFKGEGSAAQSNQLSGQLSV